MINSANREALDSEACTINFSPTSATPLLRRLIRVRQSYTHFVTLSQNVYNQP